MERARHGSNDHNTGIIKLYDFLLPANDLVTVIRVIGRGGVRISEFVPSGEFVPTEDVHAWIDRAVAEYGNTLYRVAYHCLRSHADAEDIVHDVLVCCLEKAPVFHDREHEKAWLIRVTVNRCRDVSRTAWKRRVVGLEHRPEQSGRDRIPSHSLLSEVLALPPDYSTVLYLHYYEGYSVREIARILQKHERAVQSRLYRARQALKQRLEGIDLACVLSETGG